MNQTGVDRACRFGEDRRCDVHVPLHFEDGSDAGEATYSVMIRPGEEILVGDGRRFRVLGVVPIDDEESRFVGMLQVEGA